MAMIAPSGVAPHTGAWIETLAVIVDFDISKSPLTQGRGLKHVIQYRDILFFKSVMITAINQRIYEIKIRYIYPLKIRND